LAQRADLYKKVLIEFSAMPARFLAFKVTMGVDEYPHSKCGF